MAPISPPPPSTVPAPAPAPAPSLFVFLFVFRFFLASCLSLSTCQINDKERVVGYWKNADGNQSRKHGNQFLSDSSTLTRFQMYSVKLLDFSRIWLESTFFFTHSFQSESSLDVPSMIDVTDIGWFIRRVDTNINHAYVYHTQHFYLLGLVSLQFYPSQFSDC